MYTYMPLQSCVCYIQYQKHRSRWWYPHLHLGEAGWCRSGVYWGESCHKRVGASVSLSRWYQGDTGPTSDHGCIHARGQCSACPCYNRWFRNGRGYSQHSPRDPLGSQWVSSMVLARSRACRAWWRRVHSADICNPQQCGSDNKE